MKNARSALIFLVAALLSLTPVAGKAQETAEELYKEGVRYFLIGNYDRALESLNRSIELDPLGNPDAYFYRAEVYESLGKHEGAAKDYLTSCGMGSVRCAKALPDKLFDTRKIPESTWAVGDFGYHVDSQGESAYGPGNVVDGLSETAWVTKDDPSYIFEDMMIGFKSLTDGTAREFTIRNGYCKNKDIWAKNSRVKRMLVLIDKEPVVTVTLSDTMEAQTLSLGKEYNVKTGSVISFLILEAYPGTRYDDIAISEFHPDYQKGGFTDEAGVAEIYSFTKKFDTGDAITSTPAVWGNVVYIAGWSGVLYAVDATTNRELWRFDSKSGIRVSPRAAEGIVYFGNTDGILYALDAKTGQELWRFTAEGWINESPSVFNNVVCFVAGARDESINNKLYAVDAKSGKELWRFEGERWNDYPACFDNGVICFASDKAIHAVNAKTGEGLWRFETAGWTGSPTVQDGIVYFGSGSTDYGLYAVDMKTGQELWRFDSGGAIVRSAPGITNGIVYFGNDDGTFYAADARTGREVWRFEAEENGRIKSSPCVLGSVVCFVSGTYDTWFDDKLHALDIHSGQELWSMSSPGDSPLIIDGVIYTAGEFGICAVNANTGKSLWFFEGEGHPCTLPVKIDDRVYFGCEDGYLYAVQ